MSELPSQPLCPCLLTLSSCVPLTLCLRLSVFPPSPTCPSTPQPCSSLGSLGPSTDRALQTVLSCLLLTGAACWWNPDCQGLGWLFLSGAMLAPAWPPACPVCPWGLGLRGPWALSPLLPLPGQDSGTQREPLLPVHQPSPSTSTCHHASWADKSAYYCD